MWLQRSDLVTNYVGPEKFGEEKEKLLKIKTPELEYLGHIRRNYQRYELRGLILQGKIDESKVRCGRRILGLKNLRAWLNTTTVDLFRTA